jgi:hypothetical protein
LGEGGSIIGYGAKVNEMRKNFAALLLGLPVLAGSNEMPSALAIQGK